MADQTNANENAPSTSIWGSLLNLNRLNRSDWNKTNEPFFNRITDPIIDRLEKQKFNSNPAMDMEETNSHYYFNFDLPGMNKEKINITLKGQQLNITGERQHDDKITPLKELSVLKQERYYGKFSRTITLPSSVELQTIEATYHSGVLTIIMKKREIASVYHIPIVETITRTKERRTQVA